MILLINQFSGDSIGSVDQSNPTPSPCIWRPDPPKMYDSERLPMSPHHFLTNPFRCNSVIRVQTEISLFPLAKQASQDVLWWHRSDVDGGGLLSNPYRLSWNCQSRVGQLLSIDLRGNWELKHSMCYMTHLTEWTGILENVSMLWGTIVWFINHVLDWKALTVFNHANQWMIHFHNPHVLESSCNSFYRSLPSYALLGTKRSAIPPLTQSFQGNFYFEETKPLAILPVYRPSVVVTSTVPLTVAAWWHWSDAYPFCSGECNPWRVQLPSVSSS